MSQYNQYQDFRKYLRRLTHTEKMTRLAAWDQRVNMPPKGGSARGMQMSYLAAHHHQLWTSGEIEQYINELKQDDSLDEIQRKNIAEVEKDLDKAKKLPQEFVSRFTKATTEAQQAWSEARKAEDFEIFAPKLQEVVDLNLEKAEYYGYNDHPYDALLEDFEPGLTMKEVEQTLTNAREALTSILRKIKDKPEPDTSILHQYFNPDTQLSLSKRLAADLGFDFQAGHLGMSEHPFTVSMSPNDVRITTRFKAKDLAEAYGSTIHETGHALYEQGLDPENYGLPACESVSLGIHESQSRLWENNVGKSYPFIKGYLPVIKQFFPEQLGNTDDITFYKALNKVQPNLIRTAADEITYHIHILIRFEIEKALVEKEIDVKDLPDTWNRKYRDYMGIDVPSLKQGVLQDVQWAHGAIGYFPTYSLGSFYAAQFYKQAEKDISGLKNQIEGRNFASLLDWLRKNIHQHGRLYNSRELCEAITGEPLNFDYFEHYVNDKYNAIYDLA